MTPRKLSRRGRNSHITSQRRRRVLVEQLETRQLLAADVGFADTLPTAEEAEFGAMIVTPDGRNACPAFTTSSGTPEGEMLVSAPGPVDVVASISQPGGPLAPGAPFTSEITFENLGPNDAVATDLAVSFDANLTGITWEREVIRVQPATVLASDLIGSNGLSVQGIEMLDLSGFSVSGGGDFNNDGIDDFIVGAAEPDVVTTPQDGDAYVVFGTTSGFPADLSLSTLNGTNGFSILGGGAGSNAGASVDNAGDFNGDGIDDLIVGAPGADPGAVNDAGEAYVIFGRNVPGGSSFTAQISTSALTVSEGVILGGTPAGYNLGSSVSAAGDVNNDGVDDIIIGASGKTIANPGTPPPASVQTGTSYVVFGQSSPFANVNVDVTALNGSNGFEIGTSRTGVVMGSSVSAAGDVNDDGFADVIVGASGGAGSAGNVGKAYVVFGKGTAFTTPVIADSLTGSDGFSINLQAGAGGTVNVTGGMDLNNDGFDDVAASNLNSGGTESVTNVIFGAASGFAAEVDVAGLNGTNGFVINAPMANHPSEMALSQGGDINGDGVQDILIGMPAQTVGTTNFPGGGYVVFGAAAGFTSPLNLSSLNGTNGFLIEVSPSSDMAGDSIGAAGDVNGDGLDDVIVGAPFASPSSGILAGESHVVFGRGSTTTNGSGAINETLDLFPGDQVIYRVSATIAPTATGSTTVTGTATATNETNPADNTAVGTTLIQSTDTTPPTITNVYAGGSGWNPVFIDGVDGGGVGSGNGLGMELSAGQHISNAGIDRIFVQFSEDIGSLTSNQVELRGSSTVYNLGTVNYSPTTFLAEIPVIGTTVGFDKLRFSVADSVDDVAGNSLDGDNNGSAGGIYDLRFDVLPGDIDGDGQVFTTDLQGWQTAFNTLPGDANYNPDADLDGNGQIFTTDLVIWQANFNRNLGNLPEPGSSGFAPAGRPAESSLSASKVDKAFDEMFLDGETQL